MKKFNDEYLPEFGSPAKKCADLMRKFEAIARIYFEMKALLPPSKTMIKCAQENYLNFYNKVTWHYQDVRCLLVTPDHHAMQK
jgi:hypothetical protein